MNWEYRKIKQVIDSEDSEEEEDGSHDEYLSWRQAAWEAYEAFKKYDGSKAHYEAVVIIKNKIFDPPQTLLTSHNTVLNFDAILGSLNMQNVPPSITSESRWFDKVTLR